MQRTLIICLLLAAATTAVYIQVKDFEFVAYDDGVYVYDNPVIYNGLTMEGVKWVFTEPHCANWHPLTGLSHMLDCELFGGKKADAGRHHLKNLALHVLNTILLFLVLMSMTRATWRSAFVAALFALHPLHVESVAWVSERKDVLSMLFWLLAIWAYVAYARRGSVLRYIAVVILMAIGLMAKPMLVTLPMVLMLLDYWPLKRGSFGPAKPIAETDIEKKQGEPADDHEFPQRSVGFLFVEKIPLLALSVAGSILTFSFQKGVGAVLAEGRVDFTHRAYNALVSYVHYIQDMFWPTELAILYPHPYLIGGVRLESFRIVASIAILFIVSAAVIFFRNKKYLLMGWLLYLGTLVPVIGLVQVGEMARADRYTYIPLIGLFIMIAWAIPTKAVGARSVKVGIFATAIIVLAVLATMTSRQVGYWKNTKALSGHAIELHPNNYLMHVNYATGLISEGKTDEAVKHLEIAIKINPGCTNAYNNLGIIYSQRGMQEKAAQMYAKARFVDPKSRTAHYNVANTLRKKGKLPEAIKEYEAAIAIDPMYSEAHHNLGITLIMIGKMEEGIDHIATALRLKPDFPDACCSMGVVYKKQGKLKEAMKQFQKTLKLDPENIGAHLNMAEVFERLGKPADAARQLELILGFDPQNGSARGHLERLRRSGVKW